MSSKEVNMNEESSGYLEYEAEQEYLTYMEAEIYG